MFLRPPLSYLRVWISGPVTKRNLKFTNFYSRPKTNKQYSRDIFVFLFALLVIVAAVYTTRKTPEKLVNRDQTEEWKGWMQVQLRK